MEFLFFSYSTKGLKLLQSSPLLLGLLFFSESALCFLADLLQDFFADFLAVSWRIIWRISWRIYWRQMFGHILRAKPYVSATVFETVLDVVQNNTTRRQGEITSPLLYVRIHVCICMYMYMYVDVNVYVYVYYMYV